MTTSELNNLISAIEDDSYDNAEKALDATKEGNKKGSSIVNSRNNDYKTPLHIALEQPNPNLKIIKLLLDNDVNVNYCYSGPTDKKKQSIVGDNYLHIAARAGNKNVFSLLCEKTGIAHVAACNDDGNNPFHEAAKSGILFDVVKSIVNEIRSKAESAIKKAKEAEDWSEVDKLQKKLECEEGYIRDALCNKKYTLNQGKRTPFSFLNPEQQKKVKELAGVKDSLILNRNLHMFLYVVAGIVSISVVSVASYFLFIASQTFALSSIVSIFAGGAAFFSLKACNEIYKLCEGGMMTDVSAVPVDEVGKGVEV